MHAPFARCLSSEGFGGFVPIVSLGKLSARVSRGRVKTVRVSRGRERERAGGRSKGDMQQVVRFSKPIEIDGFPIPWQTLSLTPVPLQAPPRLSTSELLSIAAVCAYTLAGGRARGDVRARAQSKHTRGSGAELAAFITAFSPCHGFSLRHTPCFPARPPNTCELLRCSPACSATPRFRTFAASRADLSPMAGQLFLLFPHARRANSRSRMRLFITALTLKHFNLFDAHSLRKYDQ